MITREEAKEISKNAIIQDPQVLAEIAEIEARIREAASGGQFCVSIVNKGTEAFRNAKSAIYQTGGISFDGITGDTMHWAKWN